MMDGNRLPKWKLSNLIFDAYILVYFNLNKMEKDNLKNETATDANTVLCDDLRGLINGSFGIAMNANDFFNYACADMVLIDAQDLEWVIPIYKKYSWKGIDACMAYIAKQMPIKPHITKEFEEAYAEIEKINPKVHSEY